MLLEAGARVSSHEINKCCFSKETECVELLVQAFTHDHCDEWNKAGVFRNLIRTLDCEKVIHVVQLMLKFGADINFRVPPDQNTDTLDLSKWVLDAAAEQGNLLLVRMLIDSGALLTNSTLAFSIRSNNLDLINFLLDHGAKIDDLNSHNKLLSNMTPLAEAIRSGNLNLIQLLIARGASVRLKEHYRYNAAMIAASEAGNVEIVRSMLQMGISITEDWLYQALSKAIVAGHEELALLLIDADNITEDDNTSILVRSILTKAFKKQSAVDIEAILRAESSASEVVIQAIKWGDYSIIKDLLFLTEGDGSFDITDAVAIAVEINDGGAAQLLLEARLTVRAHKPGWSPRTPLAEAVRGGNIDMIHFLFKYNAEPADSIALCETVEESNEMVQVLLQEFTRRYPCGKKGYGSQALQAAIEKGDLSVINKLIGKVDIDAFCGYGDNQSPLASAIEKSDATGLTVARMLLELGINPNSIALRSWHIKRTAFMLAIRTKKVEMV